MNPSIWGPKIWDAIHTISLGYPTHPTQEQKETYYSFYKDLWKILPCSTCAVNYKQHFEELPLDRFIDNPMKLFEWTVRMHNIVNKSLGKKQLSVEEALKMHTHETDNMLGICAIVGIVIILLLFIFYKKRIL
jgi:hypothetical protein